MEDNEFGEIRPVSAALVRRIWAGVTMPVGAGVCANWQDITFMLREGDRNAEGSLTSSACERIAADLTGMAQRRRQVLLDSSDDAFEATLPPSAER